MNPLAWLIGLVLPACGFAGAGGLPIPALMEVGAIARPTSPNTALAAPHGFFPAPDIVTQDYPLPAEALFQLVCAVAARQPWTFQAAVYPDHLQVHYVVRTLVLNFPDLVMAQARQAGPGQSQLILYSRSAYGHSDLGVNRRRLQAWLDALKASLPSSSEN